MVISNAIRELRKQYGEGQQYFATRLKISISSLANYEIGTRRPDTAALLKLYSAAEDIDRRDLSEVFAAAVRESAGGHLEPIRDEAERATIRALRFILADPRAAHLKQSLIKLLDAGEKLMTEAKTTKEQRKK